MPRLQILELPSPYVADATGSEPVRTPFALILDGLDKQTAEALRAHPDVLNAFAQQCGALAVGVFELPVDLV